MKDRKIFKKWWFWLIIAFVLLGAIGSIGQTAENPTDTANSDTSQQLDSSENVSTLPILDENEYKDDEGLLIYKELQDSGYTVEAEFDNQALTDTNGSAANIFESLNPESEDDRLSVDAFVVGNIVQNGDEVKLNIVLKPTN